MQHVVTVLGDVRPSVEGICPWCETPLGSSKSLVFCPNHRCRASSTWRPEELRKHLDSLSRMQAKAKRQAEETAELMRMLNVRNAMEEARSIAKREAAEAEGFCGRCYEMSGWITKVRHTRACTKRGTR